MQLNEIRLSDELLQALYTSSLVIPDNTRVKQPVTQPLAEQHALPQEPAQAPRQAPVAEQPEVRQTAGPIQFLGKNNRKFVVLVHYPDQLHLPDDAFEFLSNVLKACQLNAADVAIVNQASQSARLPDIQAQLSPTFLICFGNNAKPGDLPAINQLVPGNLGNMKYMLAPELDVLKQNSEAIKPLKKQLWEGLKQMLQIQ